MVRTTTDFETWMRRVDALVWSMAGCSVHDLPDKCYADWHEDGMTPSAAARRAIRSEMGDEDGE